MSLIRLHFHQLAIDHSDSSVQHFHFLVQVFCSTDHADASHEAIPSVAPDALQAPVCDEQLVGIGGEIALS